jgi:hypothetical protein
METDMRFFPLAMLASGCIEEIEKKNFPPTIGFVLPAAGSTEDAGEIITIEVEVADLDHAPQDLVVAIYSDLDGLVDEGSAETSGSFSTSTTALSVGLHTLQATVTDPAGEVQDAELVTVVNGPPDTPSISITPAEPSTGDELYATVEEESISDPNGDEVSFVYDWYLHIDGGDQVLKLEGSQSLSADETAKNQTWTARATPGDGRLEGDYGEASVTILNSAPALSAASISPSEEVTTSTELVCSADEYSDLDEAQTPDNEELVLSYAWALADGTELGTDAALQLAPGTVQPGDVATCTATVTDSDGEAASLAAEVAVENTTPTLDSVEIAADGYRQGDTLTCSHTASDADGGEPEASYEWTNAGTAVSSEAAYTIALDSAAKGNVLVCTVSVTDAHGGTASGTAEATVENTPPVALSAAVDPAADITTSSLLACTAESEDADAEELEASYSWTGEDGTELGTGSSLQLDPSAVQPGGTATCTATFTDSDSEADSAAASVEISNSDPSVDGTEITADGYRQGDTLTCSHTASDPDGGEPAATYEWTNGEAVVSSEAAYTIALDSAAKGDLLVCTVTVADSHGGTAAGTAEATVENTDPVALSVSVDPAEGASTAALLACTGEAEDADADDLAVSFSWTAGDTVLGEESGLQLDPGMVQPGDTVECTATFSDADGEDAVASASVGIANSDPVLDSVSIAADGYRQGDTLTCSHAASDPDGGEPAVEYAWTNGEAVISSEAAYTIALDSASAGDALACTVTISDAHGGTAEATAEATVENTLPTVDSIAYDLAFDEVYTDTDLSVEVETSDADGDEVTLSFAWYIDGELVDGETGSTLESGLFTKGQTVYAVATPSDGIGEGDPASLEAEARTVRNSLPDVPVTTLELSDGTLSCTASTEDSDGDEVSFAFSWQRDGEDHDGAGQEDGESSSAVENPMTGEWQCLAIPYDGEAEGGQGGSDILYVENYYDPVAISFIPVARWQEAERTLDGFVTLGETGETTTLPPLVTVRLASAEYLESSETSDACELTARFIQRETAGEIEILGGTGTGTGSYDSSWGNFEGHLTIFEDTLTESCHRLDPAVFEDGAPLSLLEGMHFGLAIGELSGTQEELLGTAYGDLWPALQDSFVTQGIAINRPDGSGSYRFTAYDRNVGSLHGLDMDSCGELEGVEICGETIPDGDGLALASSTYPVDALVLGHTIWWDYLADLDLGILQEDVPDMDDFDGDGSPDGEDCDDDDPEVSTLLDEIPYDGLNNDCDGDTPDDDLDGDGYTHWMECDDSDPDVSPDEEEIEYDGLDNDCDEETLDDDLDGDGYGYSEDCEDWNPDVHDEGDDSVCDEQDNDCDGYVDEDWEDLLDTDPSSPLQMAALDDQGDGFVATGFFSGLEDEDAFRFYFTDDGQWIYDSDDLICNLVVPDGIQAELRFYFNGVLIASDPYGEEVKMDGTTPVENEGNYTIEVIATEGLSCTQEYELTCQKVDFGL